MRLRPIELAAIRANLRALDPNGSIYLYGSRADATRRGGDIDVLRYKGRFADQDAARRQPAHSPNRPPRHSAMTPSTLWVAP